MKKTFQKKLSLNKATVARLDNNSLGMVLGGLNPTDKCTDHCSEGCTKTSDQVCKDLSRRKWMCEIDSTPCR